jgi:TolB protein
MSRRAVLPALLTLAAVLAPGLAQATGPGRNGEIAFSTKVRGRSQVFTVEPDGTRLRQVTHSAGGAGQFGLAWSPDGKRLLFTVTGARGKDALVRAGADGTGATSISPPCTGRCLGDDAPSYSPDGRKIAFERAFGPIVNGNASLSAIFTMNADGTHLTQLTQKTTPTTTEDHQPRWSPDGTKIAFARVNDTAAPAHESAIEVMDADGRDVRRLTPFALDAGDPRWSPDGTRLLFNTYEKPTRGKSANLYTMRPDGTHRVALTHYSGGDLQAFADDWSPDGKRIVFRRLVFSGTDTEVGGYYVVDSRGGHLRRLTSKRVTDDALAAWGSRPR